MRGIGEYRDQNVYGNTLRERAEPITKQMRLFYWFISANVEFLAYSKEIAGHPVQRNH